MAYHRGPKIVTNGLVMYLDAANPKSYPGSGTTWYDLSGNRNNAVLYNSPTYTNSNIHTFNFDETDDYAKSANTTVLSTSAYTKIAAFRPESSTANIISGGSDSQHAFWMATTSNSINAGHNSQWYTVSYSPGDMLNQWWIGAVTFSNISGWVLYLNGQQVDSDPSTTTFAGGSSVVRIGSFNDRSNLFDGDIAISQIYNRALTPDEILQNYNAVKSRFGL